MDIPDDLVKSHIIPYLEIGPLRRFSKTCVKYSKFVKEYWEKENSQLLKNVKRKLIDMDIMTYSFCYPHELYGKKYKYLRDIRKCIRSIAAIYIGLRGPEIEIDLDNIIGEDFYIKKLKNISANIDLYNKNITENQKKDLFMQKEIFGISFSKKEKDIFKIRFSQFGMNYLTKSFRFVDRSTTNSISIEAQNTKDDFL